MVLSLALVTAACAGSGPDKDPAGSPSGGSSHPTDAEAGILDQVTGYNAYFAQPRQVDADARQSATLTAAFPGLKLSADEITGRPTMIRVPPGVRVPGASTLTPESAAMYFLRGYAAAYGLDDEAMATVFAANVLHQGDAGAGTYVVQLRQQIDGAEVHNQRLSVFMTADLELVALSGSLSPFAAPTLGRQACRVDAGGAVDRALYNLATRDIPMKAVGRRAGGRYYFQQAPAALAAEVSVAGQVAAIPVWFAMPDGIECAWMIDAELREAGSPFTSAFVHVVSGDDGRMLLNQRMSASDSFTYTVHADPQAPHRPRGGPHADALPHPTGVPDGFEPAFVPPEVIQAGGFNTNPDGASDPWLADDATVTSGNNVFAYADHDALPDGTNDGFTAGDIIAETTAPQTFNYIYDTALAPDANDTQVKAAVTQLFFMNNWLHDYWYDSGFNEAAGNAQADNYGRGGRGGDAMLAEAQDTKGRNLNNANMSTRSDGQPPRMQMYIFSGARESQGEDKLTVALPATIAGVYQAVGADFGPDVPTVVTGTLVAAIDDVGAGTDTDACEPVQNDLTGQIALIDRGTCAFVIKTRNAQAAGAIGVIIASDDRELPPRLGGADDTLVIPTIGISNADGAAIRAELDAGSTVEVEVSSSAVVETTVRRDGTIDNMISAHEWGHYFHLRNVNCGGATACGGMSEGWSDWVALHTMVRPDDDLGGVFGMSTYATKTIDPENYVYFGIRRYPYSTDRTKNDLGFRHIQNGEPLPVGVPGRPGNVNFQVHNIGEVWASALWDGLAAMLNHSKGPSARYTFEQARRRMADYVVAGMIGAPVAPTFTEQRDAILAAAFARDRRDHALLAAAFAGRGMGAGAVSPPRFTNDGVGVVESFAVAGELALAGASLVEDEQLDCDRDGALDPGEEALVHIEVVNTGMTAITETTVTLSSPSANVSFPGGAEVYVGAMSPFERESVSLRVRVEDSAEVAEVIRLVITLSDPAANPTSKDAGELVFIANVDDAATGTTLDTVDAIASPWTHADLVTAGPGGWAIDVADGNRLWAVAVRGVRSDNVLESPAIVVNDTGPFVFAFDHAFDFQVYQGSFLLDGGVVEVTTDDGVTWADVATYGVDPGYGGVLYFSPNDANASPLGARSALVRASSGFPAATRVSLDFADQLAGQTVRFRFRGANSGYTLAPAAGWRVDNIEVIGASNAPFVGVEADSEVCEPVTANAGPDQTVRAGATVALDGSASKDANGDPLVYRWRQVSGPAVSLVGADGVRPSFTAPDVAAPTAIELSLVVTDGNATSEPDTVVVTVTPNAAPIAQVGADQAVLAGQTVRLIGFGFDPDGDPITFDWTQTGGPSVVLSDPAAQAPTFVAPDVASPTTLTFALTVHDGARASAAVTTTVTVTGNGAPVANAGVDQVARAGQAVTLEGSAVDPEGDVMTFAWTQSAGPAVTLTGAASARASFVAPAVTVETVLTFVLVASDPVRSSAPSAVNVTVQPNAAPHADAGADQAVRSGEAVTLDAGASSDDDGDALSYRWRQTAGTAVTLSGAATAQASFTAPSVAASTTLRFEVIVDDGVAASRASVSVTVRPNAAPNADAGADVSVRAGETARLDGSATSDPDGDAISFSWSQTAGPAVTLVDADTASPSFVAPAVTAAAVVELRLVAGDGILSDTDSVRVNVRPNAAPIARAGRLQIVGTGATVALDGTESSDPDGDALSFQWTQTAGPAVTLRDADTATPRFDAPAGSGIQVLRFELRVSDGLLESTARTTVLVFSFRPATASRHPFHLPGH